MAKTLRAPLVALSPVTGGAPDLRASLLHAAPVTGGAPRIRAPFAFAQPVTGGDPKLRCPLVVVQALIPVPEEGPVATLVFPTLRGVVYPVKRTAQFNTGVREVTSGRETATAFMAYPRWTFELGFDYLPDRTPGSSGYTDYRTLQGFFLQLQGRFGAFLYRDDDDYRVVGGAIAAADGVTLQWPCVRDFGGFAEPVGQIDLSTLATFAATAVDTATCAINVPAHGLSTAQGPVWISSTGAAPGGLAAATAYWVIALDANNFQLASSAANALAGTPIPLTSAGSGTDTLAKGVAVYQNGALLGPAAWSLSLPNQLVFASAPAAGQAITADFDFWFVCRFTEDKFDFDKFMNQLWELEKLQFRSVIP
ncbi:MAG TPA: DUF2460 domain-containing protein [Caulobacteraceae bacterium]|nr:DUF2460 domain-containing protein [Caulobacteraceae bacterium]